MNKFIATAALVLATASFAHAEGTAAPTTAPAPGAQPEATQTPAPTKAKKAKKGKHGAQVKGAADAKKS